MVILDGYNRQILLLSQYELVLNECDLGEEYGGCRIKVMTPTTCSKICEGFGKTVQ